MNTRRIISIGSVLGLVIVICMVGLRGSLSSERGETIKDGQETPTVVDTGEEEGQGSWLSENDEGVGWILGLEKQPDGEIEVTCYNYVLSGSGVQGKQFLDY